MLLDDVQYQVSVMVLIYIDIRSMYVSKYEVRVCCWVYIVVVGCCGAPAYRLPYELPNAMAERRLARWRVRVPRLRDEYRRKIDRESAKMAQCTMLPQPQATLRIYTICICNYEQCRLVSEVPVVDLVLLLLLHRHQKPNGVTPAAATATIRTNNIGRMRRRIIILLIQPQLQPQPLIKHQQRQHQQSVTEFNARHQKDVVQPMIATMRMTRSFWKSCCIPTP